MEFGEVREKQRQRPGGEEKIWHQSCWEIASNSDYDLESQLGFLVEE